MQVEWYGQSAFRPDAFLDRMPNVRRLDRTSFETSELPDESGHLAVVPAAP